MIKMTFHPEKSEYERKVRDLLARHMSGQCIIEDVGKITVPSDLESIVAPCFVENYRCCFFEENELMKHLRLLKCHFTWEINTIDNSPGTPIRTRIQTLKQKEEEHNPNDAYEIHNYYNLVQLSYYMALCKDYSRSLELLERAASVVVNAESCKGIEDGLKYIVESNKAFVWMLCKIYDGCDQTLKRIPPFDSLNNANQAAVMGVYGVTLMELGIKGCEKAVMIFRDCTTKDPKSFEWHSCLGVALMRIRHTKNYREKPSDEECESLQRSVQLGPPNELRPMIFLAQSLREKADACHAAGEPTTFTSNINRQVRDLYDRALDANPNCNSKYLVRFADGYMKLPYPYKDIDAAEKCIQKALVSAKDDAMVNHKAATFYEIIKRDYEQALKYLKKASMDPRGKPAFPVDRKLVELRSLLEPSFNPIHRLTEMLEIYKLDVESYNMSTLMFRGLFYYLKNDAIDEAVKDWIEAFGIDELLFERELFFCLRSRCFTEKKGMMEKIEIFPHHLKKLIKLENNLTKKEMLEKILSTTEEFAEWIKKKSSQSTSKTTISSKVSFGESRSQTGGQRSSKSNRGSRPYF